MTDTAKNWPLGSVLSLTTGVLLRESFGDVTECAEFLADMPIWTHQYIVLREPLMNAVIAQHPDLPVGMTDNEHGAWSDWLEIQKQTFGNEISLRPAPEWFAARDPIADAVDLVGPEKVCVVEGGD